MKIYKAGIVGTGFIGAVHIEALRRLGNVEVSGIADPTTPREKADYFYIPNAFESYKDMIETLELDTIHICTPNNTHFEIAKYALDHNINVICEKPFTTTVEEADILSVLAKEKGLINAVNYHNRFYPMTHHLHNSIADNDLGKIFSIHGAYAQDWLSYETDFSWRVISEESGKLRAVSDIGSHWMDLAEYLTGLKIIEVFADFSTVHKTRKKPMTSVQSFVNDSSQLTAYENIPVDTEDFASILFRFENGTKGCVFISQVFLGKPNSISICIGGSKKSVVWDSENADKLIYGNRDDFNQVLEKSLTTVHPKTKSIVGYPGGHIEGFADAIKQCFKQIYISIGDNKSKKDYATFSDGLRQMILCDRIFKSANSETWVSV